MIRIGFSMGRHYLEVAGWTVAVEGETCRDDRFPEVKQWDRDLFELVRADLKKEEERVLRAEHEAITLHLYSLINYGPDGPPTRSEEQWARGITNAIEYVKERGLLYQKMPLPLRRTRVDGGQEEG